MLIRVTKKIYPYDYIPTRINTDLTDFLLTHPVVAKLATISVSIRVNPCANKNIREIRVIRVQNKIPCLSV